MAFQQRRDYKSGVGNLICDMVVTPLELLERNYESDP
jgi:hypothetical protein